MTPVNVNERLKFLTSQVSAIWPRASPRFLALVGALNVSVQRVLTGKNLLAMRTLGRLSRVGARAQDDRAGEGL